MSEEESWAVKRDQVQLLRARVWGCSADGGSYKVLIPETPVIYLVLIKWKSQITFFMEILQRKTTINKKAFEVFLNRTGHRMLLISP